MKTTLLIFSSLVIFELIFLSRAFARPEYAAEHNYTSCQLCHANPFGGGIRNENGKIYGSRNLGLGELTKNPWFQFDFRGAYNDAKTSRSQRKGIIIMTATPAINFAVLKNEKGEATTSLVGSYGLGLLDTGLHEMFALTKPFESEMAPQFMVGRFQAPFGLATDEHRTYTRLQTKTTVKDYEAGMAITGNFSHRFHYDLAFTAGIEGTSTGGASLATNDSPYATILNLRLLLFNQTYAGFSYMLHGTQQEVNPLVATSASFVMSTTGLTKGLLKGSILAELVRSKGWNNSTFNSAGIGYFIPSTDTSWLSSVKYSEAQSIDFQVNWDLTSRLTLLYKQEQFTPDINYSGDAFDRYGGGLKFYFNSNMDLSARYEKSLSTRPGLNEAGSSNAVSDFTYLLFHLWI